MKLLKYLLHTFLYCATLTAAYTTADYCNPNLCPHKGKHIACSNEGKYSNSCNSNAKIVRITGDLRDFILNKLNEYRNKVASGTFENFNTAHHMATLQWDTELATLAELAVKQCKHQRNVCTNTARFKHVGQNVAHIVFRVERHNLKNLIAYKLNKWFEAYRYTTQEHINQLNPASTKGSFDISSFTQIIQERATHVGCAILRQTSKRTWGDQFIVCNFARENFMNQPVYKSGGKIAGAGCKSGINPKYPNLCSINEHYDVNVVDDFGDVKIKPPIRFSFKTDP